jgi:hypothetical protein
MARSNADHLAARIRLAEDYPYHRPPVPYLFDDGVVRPLEEPWREARMPVIAFGSNAAPIRLATKFAGMGARIAVTPARLRHYAVVYSAHFSSYGSLPATLDACRGATTRLCLTWLTEPQLLHMHRTEGTGERYDYVELSGLDLVVERGGQVRRAGAYLSRRGALALGGRPVRLAEVPTENCPFEACSQPAMLRRVHRLLAPQDSYATFMTRIIDADDYRRQATLRLVGTSVPVETSG